ncbi:MAG TPA: demethoxyubiquinone hydroxylase family protein [Candidatus Obscuribacterales bacterium]
MNDINHRAGLIHVLQMAYSGEKAAGLAYNAHWKSLKSPQLQQSIRRIEQEEWDHRQIVGAMLKEINAHPQRWREWMMTAIGTTVGFSCYLIGRFLPMYFAGRLEHGNVKEYDLAADHAEGMGLDEFAAELRRLSLVELQHEQFFLSAISGHALVPYMHKLFGWGLGSLDQIFIPNRSSTST